MELSQKISVILDLKEEFVRDFVFLCLEQIRYMRGSIYLEHQLARPLIAKKQIEIAHQTGADAVSQWSNR